MHRLAYRAALGSLGVIARMAALRKPTIFCFHSVLGDAPSVPSASAMAVSASYLERLILDLRAQGTPVISLADAVGRIRAGDRDPFLVLTFDDGYRDNYDILFPMMARLQAPFTVFVTTGLVDRAIPMWWESLTEIASARARQQSGGVSVPELTERFRSAGPEDQRALLKVMTRGSSAHAESQAYERSLSWDMLREMSASGLVTIGSHTQHHPMLSRLSRDEIRAELTHSRERIEQEIGTTVDYLAYPYGQPWEVGETAREVAREVGFKAAFSTIGRPLDRSDNTDMFNLPRILLSSKAQTTNIALGYMSGLHAALTHTARAAASR